MAREPLSDSYPLDLGIGLPEAPLKPWVATAQRRRDRRSRRAHVPTKQLKLTRAGRWAVRLRSVPNRRPIAGECVTVGRVRPVSGTPILDHVGASRLQVVRKQVPERLRRVVAEVGCVVDDQVEPVGSHLPRDPVEDGGILLEALIDADATVLGDLHRVQIQAGNGRLWQQIAPEKQRSTSLDSELEKGYRPGRQVTALARIVREVYA